MKRYVRNIGRTNQILRTSFILQMNPKTTLVAKAAHKAALVTQKSIHAKYAYNRIKNNYCRKRDALPFLLSPPYREKGLLLFQNGDGTSQVRRTRWEIIYWHKNIALSASLGPLKALGKHLEIVTSEVW